MNTYTAVKITVAYILVGFVWIVAGDSVVGVFIETKSLSPISIFYINLAKGILYVLLTGVALFLYTRRSISKLTNTEERFKSYSQRITHIMDSITDGFVTLDNNWKFIFVNKTFQEISGKRKDELIGHSLWELFPQLKETIFFDRLNKAVSERVSLHFEEQYFENGHWYSSGVYPIDQGLAIYFSDITENYYMRDEIFKTKKNLNALINNTSDLIWSLGIDLKLISFNDAYKEFVRSFTGVAANEGDDVACRILPGLDPKRWDVHYERAFGGDIFSQEEYYTLPDGNLLYFDVNFNPIFNEEKKVIGVGCFARNVTDRKKHEMEVEEQNKKLMEIAWLQSHEVRGPLSTLMGLMALFNTHDLNDPENVNILQMMEITAKKLDEVVQSIVAKANDVREVNDDLAGRQGAQS